MANNKNKQLVENPAFEGKIKGEKPGRYHTEEQKEIQKFVIILLVVGIVIAGIYFITDRYMQPNPLDNAIKGQVNYDIITVGTLLNRLDKEYYVIVYDQDNFNASNYATMVSKFKENKDNTKIYSLDLGNSLNKPYYNINKDNNSNPNAKTIDDLNFGNITLLKIVNNNIVSYEENINNIRATLK